jgi:hypothetical protein
MLCRDCPDQKTCTKLCERAEKWVKKDYVSQKELSGGLTIEYDNSTVWPDDRKLDPDVLARQIRSVDVARTIETTHEGEDDIDHIGSGLKGKRRAQVRVYRF